jgi:hypothetical protein
VEDVEAILKATRVPSEFSRRTRELDFPNLKAEEYRNIIIFYFPAVLSLLRTARKERIFFAQFVYFVRALILPENEFTFQPEQITCLKETLYQAYEVFQY